MHFALKTVITLILPIFGLFLFALTGPASAAVNPDNFLIIQELEGITSISYPVQIGRPFLQGEVPFYPQAVVDGQAVFTQADVKMRWPDGSVKHAILSFLVPQLPAQGSVRVTFRTQFSGNNDDYLLPEEMLDQSLDFNASIRLQNDLGQTATASARAMIEAGHFTYWTKGPVATTVILADHSADRIYDLGFSDPYRPFRPIFHACFWPVMDKVRVRYIGEVANTEAFKDMDYDLTLSAGSVSPETVFTQQDVHHCAATRWTRTAWINEEPPRASIDHNLPYLVQTCFFPNYDLSKHVSEEVVASAYQKWLNAPKALYDSGLWYKQMGTAGGRAEIGPYPRWTVRWLYTFDDRMREQCFGHADLAAAWPVHFREGAAGKNLRRSDPAGAGTGMGRVMSITDRKSLFLIYGFDYYYTDPGDTIHPAGPYSNGGWSPDDAHQPDPFSPQYTLTGDFWYLEEMWFWASWSAALYNGADTDAHYSRGPTGAEGGLHGETRGEAWVFRNRATAAFLSPDDAPEKMYFSTLLLDAIAIFEGMRDIRGTAFEGTTNWNWANGHVDGEFGGLGPPPLHQWDRGNGGLVNEPLDPSMVQEGLSTWEQHFLLWALGRGGELGFPTQALVSWLGEHFVGILTHPVYDPHLIATYREPSIRLSDGLYFQSWPQLRTGFLESYDPQERFEYYLEDAEHGYSYTAVPAVSMIFYEPGGYMSWQWMEEKVLSRPELNDNPKWAILPRMISQSPPEPQPYIWEYWIDPEPGENPSPRLPR